MESDLHRRWRTEWPAVACGRFVLASSCLDAAVRVVREARTRDCCRHVRTATEGCVRAAVGAPVGTCRWRAEAHTIGLRITQCRVGSRGCQSPWWTQRVNVETVCAARCPLPLRCVDETFASTGRQSTSKRRRCCRGTRCQRHNNNATNLSQGCRTG